MFRKLKKRYVSDTDQFLNSLNHPQVELSESQKAEIKKFERIYRLRDNVGEQEKPDGLWEDF